MPLSTSISILVIAALALLAAGILRRARLWRQGRPEAVALFAGLSAMPRRYLVDLHHVVGRDKYMSNTHVATAGGFVLSMLLIIAIYVLGLDTRWLRWALVAATGLMFCGAVAVFLRRRQPPSRLSKGPWMRLPKSLLSFAGAFLLTALPAGGLIPAGWFGQGLAVVLLALVLWGLAEMLFGMGWGGPMKHALAGSLHLAWHRRPERFGGGRSTALKVMPLEQEQLGVAAPQDFTWNQLLGFDACVQCGRCEAVCPAFAAGQPLNPKKLIQDMVAGMEGRSDASYRGSPYPGVPVGESSGLPDQLITNGLLKADTLWACTTCRACVEECPMMIEHVDAVVDMRRHLTLDRGETPVNGVTAIDNLIATDNPLGLNPGQRMNWAADLDLPLIQDCEEQADVLLWMGEGAFDMRSQRILRAFVTLLRRAGVSFAVLGNDERDCGDVARRLGDEATFQNLARRNIEQLKALKFNRIVTTDPHAYHCLKNEYRTLGGEFTVQHHSEVLADLMAAQKLPVSAWQGDVVTYHDPCYLGRYNGGYTAPRQVLEQLGITVVEMERSGFRSRCCGGGGGAPLSDVPGEQRIADMRMEDVKSTGAGIVAVACQQCTAMLEGVPDSGVEVRDISELVLSRLEEIQ